MDTQYEVLAGDPDLVERKGREYQAIASAITRSVRTLDDIVEQVEQKSLAMTATRDLAHDVASDIRRATDRYQATGEALVAYAAELRRTQDDSRDPVARIAELEEALATARRTAARRDDELFIARLGGDDDAIESARTAATDAAGEVSALEGALATQQQRWHDIQEEKATAARTAVGAITEVTNGERADGLDDSGWDRFGAVLDFVKVICDIAAILSVFLAWVPVLGQVLLVLAAIGAIIAVVDAAIKFKNGEGSLGDLLVAVVVGVLSLYGGKLLGFAAQRIRFSMTQAVRATGSSSGMVSLTGRAAKIAAVSKHYPGKVPQGFLGALKSPFVRSTDDLHRMVRFRKQGEGFFSVLRSAAKQGNPFNLKSLLKFDSDVADVFHLSTRYAQHFDAALHNKANLLVILEAGHSLYELGRTGVSLTDAFSDGDARGGIGTGTGHLSGPVPSLVGGGARLWKDLETHLANGTN